jgi:hypothetical protein
MRAPRVLAGVVLLLFPALARGGPSGTAVRALAAVAKHADGAIAALRGGKPAAEAFAPWVAHEKEDGERAAAVPRAATLAGVAEMRTRLLTDVTLYLTKGGKPVYAVSADVWFDDKGASLLALAGSADARDLEGAVAAGAVPLASLTGDAQPFGDAALGLKVALSDPAKLPWADAEAVAKQMPAEGRFGAILLRARECREKIEAIAKAASAAAADGLLVAPGRLAALGPDASGRTVAALVLGLRVARAGRLAWSFEAFEPLRGEEPGARDDEPKAPRPEKERDAGKPNGEGDDEDEGEDE